jgi:hypothetical protein
MVKGTIRLVELYKTGDCHVFRNPAGSRKIRNLYIFVMSYIYTLHHMFTLYPCVYFRGDFSVFNKLSFLCPSSWTLLHVQNTQFNNNALILVYIFPHHAHTYIHDMYYIYVKSVYQVTFIIQSNKQSVCPHKCLHVDLMSIHSKPSHITTIHNHVYDVLNHSVMCTTCPHLHHYSIIVCMNHVCWYNAMMPMIHIMICDHKFVLTIM